MKCKETPSGYFMEKGQKNKFIWVQKVLKPGADVWIQQNKAAISHTGVPVKSPSCSIPSASCKCTLKGSGWWLGDWAPATMRRTCMAFLGVWLCPDPAMTAASIWGVNLRVQDQSLLPLPFKQIKTFFIILKLHTSLILKVKKCS